MCSSRLQVRAHVSTWNAAALWSWPNAEACAVTGFPSPRQAEAPDENVSLYLASAWLAQSRGRREGGLSPGG